MRSYYGIYRGLVVFNSYGANSSDKNAKSDPQLFGKCKIWVPGVYPSEYKDIPKKLPWAEPAYGLFGNDAGTQGINSVPAVGTYVWVFFEEGDHGEPIYFLACQGGSGWTSEHVKQHTINTETVSIVLDDAPADGTKNAVLNIDVNNAGDEAVEINITGNVKLTVTGNVEETITGNVSKTVTGDVTETITGNVSKTVTGTNTETIVGTKSITSTGPLTITGNPTTIN